MSYRLLLDENIEHGVLHRLRNYGHDVEHIDRLDSLTKGTEDRKIGRYSIETDRIIVTYDDDFVRTLREEDFRAVLYVAETAVSATEIADAIGRMASVYPQSEVRGVEYLGNWL